MAITVVKIIPATPSNPTFSTHQSSKRCSFVGARNCGRVWSTSSQAEVNGGRERFVSGVIMAMAMANLQKMEDLASAYD